MRKVSIIFGLAFLIYSLTLLFTKYSLTGFWTDVIFFLALLIILTLSLYKTKSGNLPLLSMFRIFSLSTLVITIAYYGYAYMNAFDIRKDTKSLKTQKINGRRFHPYFQPVGSWGKGYGLFWITESPKLLPFIEKTVFVENGTDYDFDDTQFDGTPIEEIVRNYILEYIIAAK
jgi:hypothetical protein